MKMDKKTKLAYAAGILDGEGCIRISKRNPRNGRSTSYNLLVHISQKDGGLIDWLYGNFGGMIYLKNKKLDCTDWIYEWRISEKKAYNFLKQVEPLLIVKRPQAKLAIRFQQRRVYEHIKRDNRQQFKALPEFELKKREEIYQEMSKLKKQYKKSKNPNVIEYTFKSMVQV